MKKLFSAILVLLGTGAAYALPLGNPSEPGFLCDGIFLEGCCYDFCQPGVSWCDAFSFRLGYYGDFVFNRHVEVDRNESDSDIEHVRVFTNAAYLAFNFWNRFDIFVTLGATNLCFETNSSSFIGVSQFRYEIETGSDFSWSIGARAILLQWCCFDLGAEAQYFHTRPDIKRITFNETESIYADHILDCRYHEWQFGFGISRRIWNLIPYIGIKFSKAHYDFDNASYNLTTITTGGNVSLYTLKSKQCVGYAVGVSLIDCEKAAVTAEARFGDERALYVNGQVRF